MVKYPLSNRKVGVMKVDQEVAKRCYTKIHKLYSIYGEMRVKEEGTTI